MKGLRRSDELDARVRERRRLRATGDAREPRLVAEEKLGLRAHVVVRLDRVDAGARLEQKAGEDAGARAEIRHGGTGVQAVMLAQDLEHFGRVRRPRQRINLRT